ncbi:CPBP family intramembrane glutamic endopeptidase [Parapedobacter pyrenivorans]|uniref:CPBP family intramembrane glutamic endopeptidase n=1 Tax=Parapedobacter pyrenivorans TaxID=1305674 RepID=UPI00334000C4
MEKLLNTKPVITISLLSILFFAVPFVPSLLLGYSTGVSLLSALLLLLFSWLLYRRESQNLSELGLNFKRRRIHLLPLGIIIGILFFSVLFSTQMLHNGMHIRVNTHAEYLLITKGALLLLPAVLVEELIFRGYCFKRTVDQAGILGANLIFAFLFVIWHWIAFNAWGNYGMMFGLITTGFGHWLFSTALLKSGSLYFPIGIHLGNNWAAHNLFSSSTGGINTQPSNDALFIITAPKQDPSLLQNAISYLITLLCFLIFIWMIGKWKKKTEAA